MVLVQISETLNSYHCHQKQKQYAILINFKIINSRLEIEMF